MKPHPRIYEAAFERMGVEGDEAVMVGDNARADVEGAKTMGMTAILRRPGLNQPVEATEDEPEPSGPVQPDYVISEIGEMKTLPIFGA
jgi:putative hydrolase of the HAD superfamily